MALSGIAVAEAKMMETLTSKIVHKLGALSTENSYISCIYRVPDKPLKANEAAYTPQLVSLGPLHGERGQLQGMESYKLRCLRNFLNRSTVGLDELVKFIAERESYIREHYEDTINLNQEQFTEMFLQDGIFVIELFLKKHFVELRERREALFDNRWMRRDLLHDMLLLENQLPMRIITDLFRFVNPSLLNGITLHALAHEFFTDVGNTGKLQLTEDCCSARHFVEFLLFLHSPRDPKERLLVRATKFENIRGATELQQAGVKFCRAKGNCWFDAVFAENGVLTLPRLVVDDLTETFFWNLIAFEHCGIIKNELGESKAVAELFNNLYKEVVTETDEFYFAEVCDNLNAYSSDSFHEFKAKWFRWRRIAKRDYFGTPWSVISLLAASVLLILTVIQTVWSILWIK
ncbi:hypothetical protein CDL12_04621 [Handroanthus impetiginosus]|uniref:Uncharacterized protein n=1 Tax=Handroanthus impetiginosus TaxID=429701 RepID=A0A2G9HYT6_9LAMI|nr:hypothetical protein CDL12_04621 [Handroanthus impetiginosus]